MIWSSEVGDGVNKFGSSELKSEPESEPESESDADERRVTIVKGMPKNI